MLLLIILTSVILVGTAVAPVSKVFAGRTVQLGPGFYNSVLTPIGLALLVMTAPVPLLRWGSAPDKRQRRALFISALTTGFLTLAAYGVGCRHALTLSVLGVACFAVCAVIAAFFIEVLRRTPGRNLGAAMFALLRKRREFAGYFVHLGFACLVAGIAGSSIGTLRREAVMQEGDVIRWADRQIRYVRLVQRETDDKLIAETELQITDRHGHTALLNPARHLHLQQDVWTTEVGIDSTWSGDFYTVLHAGLGEGRAVFTFVWNPMMRWLWLGGALMASSALIAAWPARRLARSRASLATARQRDAVMDAHRPTPMKHSKKLRRAA
jgi:cytochrome c-type biogenesis protein CcmF